MAAVIALAKKHKQTLGFLPDAAFQGAAEAGNLVLAYRDEVLVGYSLYRVTRSTIKLTHVCVDTAARGQRLGQALISHVIAAHPGAHAISARCRRDYGLNGFWTAAGLSPFAEIAGRNAKGLPLTLWRRELGSPDLLSFAVLESDLPLAVLDSNIVIDLNASPAVPRPHRAESQALMADWLADEVKFAVSVQLNHELDDNDDAIERVLQVQGSQDLPRLPTTWPDDQRVEQALVARFGVRALARDRSIQKDVRHLADAIRANARYFVTNDAGVIGASSWLREEHGLTVVRPHELIRDVLDESGAFQTYAAGVFESIDLRWSAASELTESELERAFMNYDDHEQGTAFRATLRAALAHGTARVLVDDLDAPLALAVEEPDGEIGLRVPLLRVSKGPNSSSIALQLARQLRVDVLRSGHRSVIVSDPWLPRKILGALREDGFTRLQDGELAATPLDLTGTIAAASDLSGLLGEHAPGDIDLSPALSRDLEWKFWPLKLWDDTPCYVVPIKPNFAMDLFGYPVNLLPQRRALGLSRRHVYFRSGHSNPFRDLPARILWYVSTHKDHHVQQFFALSLGVESHMLPTDEAHARFGSLGVYRRKNVDAAAKQGNVNVLVVEDTEILTRPITLDAFRSRAGRYDVRAEFQAPRKIPPTLFRELMEDFNQAGRFR